MKLSKDVAAKLIERLYNKEARIAGHSFRAALRVNIMILRLQLNLAR